MRKLVKKDNIIEIKEDVRVGNILLEMGDKIKIFERESNSLADYLANVFVLSFISGFRFHPLSDAIQKSLDSQMSNDSISLGLEYWEEDQADISFIIKDSSLDLNKLQSQLTKVIESTTFKNNSLKGYIIDSSIDTRNQRPTFNQTSPTTKEIGFENIVTIEFKLDMFKFTKDNIRDFWSNYFDESIMNKLYDKQYSNLNSDFSKYIVQDIEPILQDIMLNKLKWQSNYSGQNLYISLNKKDKMSNDFIVYFSIIPPSDINSKDLENQLTNELNRSRLFRNSFIEATVTLYQKGPALIDIKLKFKELISEII